MDFKDRVKYAFTGKFPINDVHSIQQFLNSKKGTKIVSQLMRTTDSLTKKDVGMWRQAWQVAINIDNPNRSNLYDIYSDCLIDLHLTGCIGQRKGMTLKENFMLAGKNGKINEDATKLLEQEWFYDFIDLALDSRFWGHSLIQLGDVITDENGMRFDGVELVPRKHVCPEHGVILKQASDDWHDGFPFRDGQIADYCIEVGKKDDLGLLLKCAPSCISKKNMLSFWDMFGEVFGAPIRIAKTSTCDQAERSRIENALDTMGNMFWAVLPDNTDVEIKESTKGDAFNVYDKRIDRCNSELSKGVLNQTMTIDNGSSLSQSQTHLEVFENIVREDKKMIAYVVNGKLLPIMAKHGFNVASCSFQWDDAASFTPADIREEERLLLDHYDIDPKYFVAKYNIPITGKKKQDPSSFFA